MQKSTFEYLVYAWILLGILTFIFLILKKVRAPYGRHSNERWGPTMDNKWGWFWMELPALVLMPFLASTGPQAPNTYVWVLIALWVIHYFNRVLVFPFRLRTEGKRIPVFIVLSAFAFNVINGFVNGYYLGHWSTMELSFNEAHLIIGMLVFLAGMIINHQSDTILINLRKVNKGYQIPKGGMFEWVSCPNHLGEIIEWVGFAIVAWNLPALSFAVWTFCNLVPRTLNHHAWYKERFENYPEKRKAVIPGIL
ncbi:MAG: DUF1295 domain-containing protein [Saprospiraceae bacterium]|nr:DUF1295 domain-containing protein [Saprospiraceae bacterium]